MNDTLKSHYDTSSLYCHLVFESSEFLLTPPTRVLFVKSWTLIGGLITKYLHMYTPTFKQFFFIVLKKCQIESSHNQPAYIKVWWWCMLMKQKIHVRIVEGGDLLSLSMQNGVKYTYTCKSFICLYFYITIRVNKWFVRQAICIICHLHNIRLKNVIHRT